MRLSQLAESAPNVGVGILTLKNRGFGLHQVAWEPWASSIPSLPIGAQFAHPEKTVIDIDGDGNAKEADLGDLETITNYDLPVKVLLLNNSGDGMVKQWQKLYYGGRLSASDQKHFTQKTSLCQQNRVAFSLQKN